MTKIFFFKSASHFCSAGHYGMGLKYDWPFCCTGQLLQLLSDDLTSCSTGTAAQEGAVNTVTRSFMEVNTYLIITSAP